jgi:hypothetical protein
MCEKLECDADQPCEECFKFTSNPQLCEGCEGNRYEGDNQIEESNQDGITTAGKTMAARVARHKIAGVTGFYCGEGGKVLY